MTEKFYRCGTCNNCGDCCILLVDGNYVRCAFYDLDSTEHCTIYEARPQVCREFPRGPMDLYGKPHCGFFFVDERGRRVDGYQDPSTRLRLVKAINKLSKKQNK